MVPDSSSASSLFGETSTAERAARCNSLVDGKLSWRIKTESWPVQPGVQEYWLVVVVFLLVDIVFGPLPKIALVFFPVEDHSALLVAGVGA
jgi:hypothetical protein